MPVLCPDIFKEAGKKTEVSITSGMSAHSAAIAIRDAGVSDDPQDLVRWMVKFGIDRSIKPGIYKLRPGNALSVAKQLKDAIPETRTVTIIPGMRYRSISYAVFGAGDKKDRLAQILAKDDIFPEEMRGMLPKEPRGRIIFLLPETYFLSPGDDIGEQFVRRASRLWFERVGKNIPMSMDSDSLFKRGILASLVENEAKVPEDRPVLAGIFLNRLNKNMRLQSCATVIYCWEEKGQKKNRLTYKDLEIDSPYNTYTNTGLPPGPISVPSIGSWESALNPQKSDYLFFFATDNGSHIFSRTYEEHLRRQKKEANQ